MLNAVLARPDFMGDGTEQGEDHENNEQHQHLHQQHQLMTNNQPADKCQKFGTAKDENLILTPIGTVCHPMSR